MAKAKKLTCLLLACAMLAGTAAGCGTAKRDGGTTGGDAAVVEPSATTGEKNEFGWEMPKDTLKLTFFDALQGSPSDREKYDAKLHDYILEKFNVDLNIIQYDTDPNERINLMLSSNDYADSIYYLSATQTKKFVDQGKAVDLVPYMEKTTALKERLDARYNWMFRTEDGKQFAIPVQADKGDIEHTNLCADNAPMLRQDWYEEIGSPDVSTPEKYFEAIKAMVAKHPTNAAGKKTYGLSFYDTKLGAGIVPSFASWWGGMFGLRQGWDWDETNTDAVLWVNSEKGEKLIKYINKFSREGLLDPDGMVMPVEQWGEKGIDERYAAYVGPWFQPGFYISDHWYKLLGDKYQPLMRYVHYNVTDEAVENSTFNPQNAFVYQTIITDKAKNPADYMRWFDFEHSDIGVKLMGYGIPNTEDSVWTIDESGKTAMVQEKIDEITAPTPIFDFEKMMLIGGEGQMTVTSTAELLSDGTSCWFNQSNKDKWKLLKDENMKPSFYTSTPFAMIVMDPKDPLTDVKQRCADIIYTGFANAISAKTEEECMQIFTKMRDDANAAGLKDVEKFYADGLKKNLEAAKAS